MNTQIKRVQLFNASCVALVVTALTFATRAGMIDPWIQEFGLNATEVGWIVIGGLAVYILNSIGYGWRVHMAIMLLPTLLYGFMFIKLKFPKTERVLAGVSAKEMYKSVVTPLFIFMACCMVMTAMTELGTNQWIAALLENLVYRPFYCWSG
jgi:hypothetical protein